MVEAGSRRQTMTIRELHIPQQESLAIEHWADSIVYFIVALGFALRLVVAASTFLDPDEAFHFALGNQPTLQLAYRASLSSAHPPLLVILIYVLRGLGHSELMLRFPSVIAGTLSCWLGYKWLLSIAQRGIALTGLVLLALSPPLFALESEVRQYALLLLFVSAALYWFESAVQGDSWSKMTLFGLALCAALTAHYGALLFAVSMGMYALLRFLELRPGASVLLTWACGQAAFLALAVFFYRTHVPVVERGISDSWLRKSFYHSGDHVISFVLTNTYRFFHFLFGQPVIGTIMLLLFVAGLVFLMPGWPAHAIKFRRAGVLVVFALALSWALALAGLYPFGGTRHGVFLLPFIVLAIASGLVNLLKKQSRTAPVIAAGAMAVCSLVPVPAGPHIQPPNQNVALMRRAVGYAQHAVTDSDLVLVDQQTVFPFRYYFCREDIFPFQENPQNFICGGYRVHKSGAAWDLSGEHLTMDLVETRAAFETPATAAVLVFQTGWSVGQRGLANKLNEYCRVGARFGKNILACEVK